MTKEEKIRQLYYETYEEEDHEITLEEMTDALESYYGAAGFDIKSVDDLFKHHNMPEEFTQEMERRIQEVLQNRK